MNSPARPIHVVLLMHSTRSDNLGVGALTVSEIAILRDLAGRLGRGLRITALDGVEPRAPYVTGPDITVIDMTGAFLKSPKGFWALVRGADLVIDIGGGDSFTDIYANQRLTRMFWMKFVTHIAGTPMVLAPQTIGPFTKPLSKALAKLDMRLSKVVTARDDLSTAAARAMGITSVIEASDVALRLPYDPPPPRAPGGPVKVGLNVSGLLMAGGYAGANDFGLKTDYPSLIRSLIRRFQAKGAEVHLVSHVIVHSGLMTGEDDFRAAKALAEEFPGTVLAPDFPHPSAAKSYIAGLDFFTGARMHACIAAFSSGVPVVPMAYSRKFHGLFGSLGFNRTVDYTSESAEAIEEKILAAFDDPETLAAEAAAALAKGRAKLATYENALLEVMRKVPA